MLSKVTSAYMILTLNTESTHCTEEMDVVTVTLPVGLWTPVRSLEVERGHVLRPEVTIPKHEGRSEETGRTLKIPFTLAFKISLS